MILTILSISDQREGGGYNPVAATTQITESISDQREGGGYNEKQENL
ncbi:hypothetical protein [uncultured Gammaproteobacteria bacterium]|nr:hypothetical protein [uncultured Gammaproteobacteria bacterium]